MHLRIEFYWFCFVGCLIIESNAASHLAYWQLFHFAIPRPFFVVACVISQLVRSFLSIEKIMYLMGCTSLYVAFAINRCTKFIWVLKNCLGSCLFCHRPLLPKALTSIVVKCPWFFIYCLLASLWKLWKLWKLARCYHRFKSYRCHSCYGNNNSSNNTTQQQQATLI